MAEKVKKEETVSLPVNPFNIRRPYDPAKQDHAGEFKVVHRISRDQVEVNKDTLFVKPVLEAVDITEEIQTYKDLCGYEYFIKLLSTGLVKPEASHDDGSHAVDLTGMPATIHDAAKAADKFSDEIAKYAKALGLKDNEAVTADKLVDLITAQVQANIAASQKKEEVK